MRTASTRITLQTSVHFTHFTVQVLADGIRGQTPKKCGAMYVVLAAQVTKTKFRTIYVGMNVIVHIVQVNLFILSVCSYYIISYYIIMLPVIHCVSGVQYKLI